ncbi:UNVERIFIED_CONTAM: cytochrome [Sesamum radiatum]|uniref:Cytochrome n=1 Tax=Sesamum radiatum TaxID=300843 RepID=A0AAW2M3K3_SESRA
MFSSAPTTLHLGMFPSPELQLQAQEISQASSGPYPIPIIGNILQLGQNPHQTLAKLSKTYGPIMHVKLGSRDTIVVSSPEIAKEILQKHDQAFPLRMTTAATRALDRHMTSVAFLPVGRQWGNLRKICKEQMFSTPRLYANQGLRQEQLQRLLQYIQECCVKGRAVDIGQAAMVTAINLMSKTLFSVDFAGYDAGSCEELEEIIRRLMRAWGAPNLGDYFGLLGLFDPQGIKREAEFCLGKLLAIFDGIIDQRVATRNSQARKTDLLEVLLEISDANQAELTREEMKHLLLDLFIAGADTTAGAVEWVMTELMRNPQDGDDLEIKNYFIPKYAVILINIWAIGRDPSIWPNPHSFEPERFLNSEVDTKGHDFELIPFGGGRRICPGVPLAQRMLHVTVASLVHNFDWELEPGNAPEDVDLNEKFGLSLQKAVPLKAVPTKP